MAGPPSKKRTTLAKDITGMGAALHQKFKQQREGTVVQMNQRATTPADRQQVREAKAPRIYINGRSPEEWKADKAKRQAIEADRMTRPKTQPALPAGSIASRAAVRRPSFDQSKPPAPAKIGVQATRSPMDQGRRTSAYKSFAVMSLGDYHDELKKGGTGSRGGNVIGRTKSGKPIYDKHNHSAHSKFDVNDHLRAANLHYKLAEKHDRKHDDAYYRAGMNDTDTSLKHERASAHHAKQWTQHTRSAESLAKRTSKSIRKDFSKLIPGEKEQNDRNAAYAAKPPMKMTNQPTPAMSRAGFRAPSGQDPHGGPDPKPAPQVSLATKLQGIRSAHARATGDYTSGIHNKPVKPSPAMDYSKVKKPQTVAQKSSKDDLESCMEKPTLKKKAPRDRVIEKSSNGDAQMSKTNFNDLFKSELGADGEDKVLIECPHCDEPITKSEVIEKAARMREQNTGGGKSKGGGKKPSRPGSGIPKAGQPGRTMKAPMSKSDAESGTDGEGEGDTTDEQVVKSEQQSVEKGSPQVTVRGSAFVQYVDTGADALLAKAILEGGLGGTPPTQPIDKNNSPSRNRF